MVKVFDTTLPMKLPHLKLALLGDIMFGRKIYHLLETKDSVFLKEILSPIKEILDKHDLKIANLENVFTKNGIPSKLSISNFKGHEKGVEILKYLGINVLNLANNHIFDYGDQGLIETVKTLEANKISFIGAGKTLEEAVNPYVFGNLTVFGGMFFFNIPTGKHLKVANLIDKETKNLFLKNLLTYQRKNFLNLCYIHTGFEGVEYPSHETVNLFHSLLNNGCHIIVGTHPHVLQGYEIHENGGIIFYSLGDFIFDTNEPKRIKTGIFSLFFDESRLSHYLTPCKINENFYMPELLKNEQAKEIENFYLKLSEEIKKGMALKKFEERASQIFFSAEIKSAYKLFKRSGLKGIFSMIKRLRRQHIYLMFKTLKNKLIKLRKA